MTTQIEIEPTSNERKPRPDPRAALQAAAIYYLDCYNALDGSQEARVRCARALLEYDRLCGESTQRFS